MISYNNYDWSQTERKLVVFIPNYGRRDLLVETIKRMQTSADRSLWHIVVGNDGMHQDLSDLSPYNVSYFTLDRGDPSPRNGGFIRNYFIRRTRSEMTLMRDPEIMIAGDYLKRAIENTAMNRVWRVGYATQTSSDVNQKIFSNQLDVGSFLATCYKEAVKPDSNIFFHYGYCCYSDVLRSMRGYDEDYHQYGYEDNDLYTRLRHLGFDMFCDPDCLAVHLFHQRNEALDYEQCKEMGHIYHRKTEQMRSSRRRALQIRNVGRDWGMG